MLVCFLRSIILYLLLILAVRLMGKRQLGELEPSEFVVSMVLADLASVPMQDLGIPLLSGVVPILTILAVELLLSALSYESVSFRRLLCGRPVILMENGRIISSNLRRTRLTPDELTEHLREKGILDLSTVQYAILETDGQISALLYPKFQPVTAKDACIQAEVQELPVTILSNGTLMRDNLTLTGRTEAWLQTVLQTHSCTMSDVLLLTVEPSGRIYFMKRDDTK